MFAEEQPEIQTCSGRPVEALLDLLEKQRQPKWNERSCLQIEHRIDQSSFTNLPELLRVLFKFLGLSSRFLSDKSFW